MATSAEQSYSMEVHSQERFGFDCEFIERPPESLQSDCPVCMLVLREPHQVTCCGYAFCQVCIERVQLQQSPCPTCKESDFCVFPDKRLQRSLSVYRIHCSHEKEGCQWTGSLREFDGHLNEEPAVNEQLSGCAFAEVECIHCHRFFQRRYINEHQVSECIKRPCSCEYCDYETNFEDITCKHWPVCAFYPVSCPNECGACPVRQNLNHHISKDCPLVVVKCDFHYAGCEVQLPHKDMPAHLAENLEVHTAQLAAHTEKRMAEKDRQIVQLTKELDAHRWKIDQLEKENEALKESLHEKILRTQNDIRMSEGGLTWAFENLKKEVVQLKAKQEENQSSLQAIRAHASVVPVELVLTEFRKHKRHSKEWYSEPFYTHPHGYKMCLRVDANGASGAKGKYISVIAYIMRGWFDIHLIWPFRGVVMVTLVNQLQDKEHLMYKIDFRTAGTSVTSRVTTGERASGAVGVREFIPHSDLDYDPEKNCQFLKDDCLHFQVTQVTYTNQVTNL